MKLVKLAVASLLICFSSSNIWADEAGEMSFSEGSVIIRCGTPPGSDNDISNKLFAAAFPNWITSLQTHANEGLISRAHYLGVLKRGMFIVVIGDTKEDAKSNSEIVLSDLAQIMEKAIKETGQTPPFSAEEACLVGEIGPIAILPQ